MTDKINRHYYLDEASKIIWHSKTLLSNHRYVYMGSSDNPKPKLAAAAFVQQGKALTGCKIREYYQE